MHSPKYYLESSVIPRTEIFPVFSGEMSWSKEDEAIYHVYGAKDKLRLMNTAYDLLKAHEGSECAYFYLDIDTYCTGEYTRHWRGRFSILGSKENEDRCWFEISPEPDTKVTCFEDALKDENVFFPISNSVTVVSVGGNYQEASCTSFWEFAEQGITPLDGCLDFPDDWCFKSNTVEEVLLGGGDNFQQTTVWHREVFTTNCVNGQPVEPPYGSGWTQLGASCAGGTTTWWKCPPSVDGDNLGPYTQGVLLVDVLEEFNQVLGCEFNIVSNFFGLNPDGTAPDNDAYTFAYEDLASITMHQKSDIKRKDDSNLSTSSSWTIKLDDLVSDLRALFNVFFDPSDETTLRIEHYSYYTTQIGLDRSTEAMSLEFDFQVKNDTREEKFFFVDERASDEFLSKHIRYACGKETTEHRCKLFSTDLGYIEKERNAERISDEDFVLIANQAVDGQLVLIDANRPLSWPVLHDRLHRHGRLFKSGSINGSQAAFSSWLPYIKQVPFKTDLCCSEQFNARDIVLTRKGEAVIEEATYNIYTKRLELQPSY